MDEIKKAIETAIAQGVDRHEIMELVHHLCEGEGGGEMHEDEGPLTPHMSGLDRFATPRDE